MESLWIRPATSISPTWAITDPEAVRRDDHHGRRKWKSGLFRRWGAATGAALYAVGVAVDSVGNLYIADTGNSRIREDFRRRCCLPGCTSSLEFLHGRRGWRDGRPNYQSLVIRGRTLVLCLKQRRLAYFSPSSGSMPAVIQVSTDPANLGAGTLSGNNYHHRA